MRTTLDIPAELINSVQELLGYKSKTDTIVFSLREILRRAKVEQIKLLAGTMNIDLDLAASRRRPAKNKA